MFSSAPMRSHFDDAQIESAISVIKTFGHPEFVDSLNLLANAVQDHIEPLPSRAVAAAVVAILRDARYELLGVGGDSCITDGSARVPLIRLLNILAYAEMEVPTIKELCLWIESQRFAPHTIPALRAIESRLKIAALRKEPLDDESGWIAALFKELIVRPELTPPVRLAVYGVHQNYLPAGPRATLYTSFMKSMGDHQEWGVTEAESWLDTLYKIGEFPSDPTILQEMREVAKDLFEYLIGREPTYPTLIPLDPALIDAVAKLLIQLGEGEAEGEK